MFDKFFDWLLVTLLFAIYVFGLKMDVADSITLAIAVVVLGVVQENRELLKDIKNADSN
jgi:hypothetical protein